MNVPEHEIKALWNRFDTKNVTYSDFRRRINKVTSPPSMGEMQNMELKKARMRTQKGLIDRAMGRGR